MRSSPKCKPTWIRLGSVRLLFPVGRASIFEEWDEPQISAIRWVSELVGIAGGDDVFADRSSGRAAAERIVSGEDVIARQPEIIIGSWCGKKFQPVRVQSRPGFDQVPAVQANALFEIKSPLILQPGPAALTDGLAKLQEIILPWRG